MTDSKDERPVPSGPGDREKPGCHPVTPELTRANGVFAEVAEHTDCSVPASRGSDVAMDGSINAFLLQLIGEYEFGRRNVSSARFRCPAWSVAAVLREFVALSEGRGVVCFSIADLAAKCSVKRKSAEMIVDDLAEADILERMPVLDGRKGARAVRCYRIRYRKLSAMMGSPSRDEGMGDDAHARALGVVGASILEAAGMELDQVDVNRFLSWCRANGDCFRERVCRAKTDGRTDSAARLNSYAWLRRMNAAEARSCNGI